MEFQGETKAIVTVKYWIQNRIGQIEEGKEKESKWRGKGDKKRWRLK